MKLNKIIALTLILVNLVTTKLEAQVFNTITKPTLTKHSLAEKIYLQIDNNLYQTGDKIWYKAIVTKSFDNSLSDISEILHVELIDFNENIIEHRLLKLKDGVANGSFDLQNSYKSGKYLIRAYTSWNRNFDTDFIFKQTINVFNLKEKERVKNPITNIIITDNGDKMLSADINPKIINPSYKGKLKLYIDNGYKIDSVELTKNKENIYQLNYVLPNNVKLAKLKFKTNISNQKNEVTTTDSYNKTIVIDENFIDIQFFPEGGKLINELLSTVAVKSTNHQGLGHKIFGEIKNKNGQTVTTFKTNHLGIGTFKLLPEFGDYYYAELVINGIVYTYGLPKAINTGSVLSVVKLKEELRVLLVSNTKRASDVRIETESRGVKYHSLSFKNRDTIRTLVSSKSLPEGIIKITALNNLNQILCERLVYNSNKNRHLKLKVKSNFKSFYQRDKTTLSISLDSLQHINNTSVSVLVLKKDNADVSKTYKSNLLSYLLLSSELKGNIENPSYYFDETNRNRALDLDALMLTQGWRNYKYTNSKETINYKFKSEKHLSVSGTIGQYFNPKKRPKTPLDINMIVFGKPKGIYNQEIDSSGKYFFELDDIFMPESEIFMQVVNKKGKPIDFRINLDKKWQPKVKLKQEELVELPKEIISNFTEQLKINNKIQRNYEVAYNTVALDEVKLRDYKLTPAREEFIGYHGEPDKVINGKELNEKAPDWNYGIFSVIRSKFKEDVKIINEGPIHDQFLRAVVRSYDKSNSFTYILVDNIPVEIDDYRLIGGIPVEEVESIDIIKDPLDKNRYCHVIKGPYCPERVALINIYTHGKKGLFGITKAKGFLINSVKGFTESVAFYAPKYETLSSQDWIIPDNRSVIHWSPIVTLNSDGKYILEYYNDDHIGEVSVIIEAISKDGKTGYVEKTYKIQESEH